MPLHEKEINTKYGRFVVDEVADAKMASRLSQHFYPQQEVLDLVEACKAQHVVDVGAHIGTVTIPLVIMRKIVTAFEPNPVSYQYLVQNCERNRIAADLRNKGLGEVSGRAHVVVHQDSNAGAHMLEAGGDIEVSTLSNEVAEADFVKIDVEGMELSVLKGAEELIQRSRPAIYFEVNLSALRLHGINLSSLTTFFKKHHYSLYFVDGMRLYKLLGLTSATFLIAPRSLLFHTRSAPFDVLALHVNAPLPYPVRSRLRSMMYLCMRYLSIQYGRIINT